MKIRTGIYTAIAAGTGYLVYERFRQRPEINLNGKIVLITGGSRGLGLAMAREFGEGGATLALCARDTAELKSAQADLTLRGIDSYIFPSDITEPDQVCQMIAEVTAQLGSIDILVNNAGTIKVGPASEMELADFEEAMDVMFWGALHTSLAVMPSMRLRGHGNIVNITSIGGKVSVPHLLPYCCAKFAATALSEGLRAELAQAGIRVTTIAPGLMRTGSHLHAQFKGRQAEEYSWFATGAATPIVSISAERAARSIVRATVEGRGEKILSTPANILARLHGLFPGATADIMALVNRMLPSETGESTVARTGREIEGGLNSRLWKALTMFGQKAAESLNEIPVVPKHAVPDVQCVMEYTT